MYSPTPTGRLAKSWRMRLAITTAILIALPLLAFSAPAAVAFKPLPSSALDWNILIWDGFGSTNNFSVTALQTYGSYMYAGTLNPVAGCEVWSYDGAGWDRLVGTGLPGNRGPGFGDVNNVIVSTMAVFGDVLYMGTSNPNGCELWTYDGTNLTKLVGAGLAGNRGPGFGDANNQGIHSMQVFGDELYLGTDNYGPGCEVWTYDGSTLTKLVGAGLVGDYGSGFGDGDNGCAHSMSIFGGDLVVGTWNVNDGCMVWSYDGSTLTQMVGQDAPGTPGTGPGFGNANNEMVCALPVFMGELYATTTNPTDGCEVWSYDGSAWTKEVGTGLSGDRGSGFGNPNNEDAYKAQVYGSNLYVGTYNPTDGAEIWRYDGASWATEVDIGLNNFSNGSIDAFAVYGATLYAGIFNITDGAQVWSAGSTFYFAEGYTGAGFQEYLCIGNPSPADANVIVTYMFQGGATQQQTLSVPSNSRATVDVNAVVGADKEVSCKIEGDQPIVAERPMYFTYQGDRPGGHDAVGANAPQYIWFFAEGYTGYGFDEWICVLNPGGETANLDFFFQTQEEGEKLITGFGVPPHSRTSFKVNDILGPDFQTSLALVSDQPIVAERPMYFNYQGWGAPKNWTGGHCVMGVNFLSQEYYFAEGTTRGDFQEWITIQNPNDDALTVDAVYQPAPGQGDNVTNSYTIAENARYTLYVPQEAGTDKDVSVKLSGDYFFLAERPMYFDYTGYGADYAGGDCAIGSPGTAAEWFFAEGYTGPGFQEWLTIQNPGDTESQVEITYYTQEAGALPVRTVTVPARSRMNVRVNDDAGPDYQLSCRLRVVSGPEIVAERPMYFDFRGIKGGHVVVGYVPGGTVATIVSASSSPAPAADPGGGGAGTSHPSR